MHTLYIQGLILLASCLLMTSLMAGEIRHAYVNHEDGHFYLQLEMAINAEVDAVYDVLVDFNNIHLLSETIKQSKWLASRGNENKVLLVTEGCIWFFCRKVKHVQLITELPNRYILSETLPAESDLEYGRVLWHIRAQENKTIISYSADFVPRFWVPPLLGPWLMKDRLLEEGTMTLKGIEQRAQQQ